MLVHVDFTVSKVLKEQVRFVHHFMLPFIIIILLVDTDYAVAQIGLGIAPQAGRLRVRFSATHGPGVD